MESRETILAALRATVGVNSKEMKQAEMVLKQVSLYAAHDRKSDMAVYNESIEPQVRLASAIALKRVVERTWTSEDDVPKLPDEDKAVIRGNLIEALVRTPDPIRAQLAEILKTVAYSDFPESWPELSDAVIHSLHMQDVRQVLGGILTLRCIARKFEFKTDVNQTPFNDLMRTTMPKILEILHSCAVSEEPADISAEILKAISKFFWSVTFTRMPESLMDPSNFKSLMGSLLLLVRKELPWHVMPPPTSEQDAWVWWKAKKWVLHLTTRFFKYYGAVDKVKDQDKLFAEMFVANVSIPMLEAHMQLLARIAQLSRPNERVLSHLVNYMDHAASITQTYKMMKEHLKPMLLNVVFPILCFTDRDAQLMEEDPEEFVRKSHDFIEDVFGVKAAASNFALNISRSRGKLVLQDFINHILGIMDRYREARDAGSEPLELARSMDGALTAIGTLEPILLRKKTYKAGMEDLLNRYVVGCFKSQFAHIRCRACWVAGKYSSTKFKKEHEAGGTFQSLLQSVVMAMRDEKLPVRVEAAVSLKYFVDAMESLEGFKFILKDLLNVFFTLMNEIENEHIVFTLETIVEKLGEDIAPFAVDVGCNLEAAFKKCRSSESNDEDDGESLCSYGCIRAMNALIESVRKSPALCSSLEDVFFPVITSVIDDANIELFEDVIEMVSSFVYFGKEVSPRMWSLVPKFQIAYMDWALDYLDTIVLCLDNYIIRGRQGFLQNTDPNYLTLINQMIETALTGEDTNEVDYHGALKLMMAVMQHLKGDVNHVIAPYLLLTAQKWKTVERSDTRVLLANVVANALWYNPSLALHALREQGSLQNVMSKWSEMLFTDRDNGKMKYFLKHSDKKICVLGLSSLLTLPDDQFPTEMQPSHVLGSIMRLLMATRRQEEEAKDISDDEDYDPNAESEDDEEGEDDGDDEEEGIESVSNDSSAYNKLLEKETRRLLLGYQGSDSDDYCESDLSSDDEDAPIYTVDPYAMFSDMLTYMETSLVGRLQTVLGEMDDAGRNALHSMLEYGRQKKAEAANGIAQQLNGNV